jgi:hypothetical protein
MKGLLHGTLEGMRLVFELNVSLGSRVNRILYESSP